MRLNIAAIIIDPLRDEHDYSSIDIKYNQEDGFDLLILDNTENITDYLYKHNGFDCIITINLDDYAKLSILPFDVRKRWCDIAEFDIDHIKDIIIGNFIYNLNRGNKTEPLFSFFTCMYKTPQQDFERLYTSMCNQTYHNWNWWIINDSPEDFDISFITKKHDCRINIISNVTKHNNIGYNKHLIGMCCNGDYLVEVDHDDELTPDCLEYLKKAFFEHPDAGFAYSDTLELIAPNTSVDYGDDFGFGEGRYRYEMVGDTQFYIAYDPAINSKTIRGIYAQPNHVRCWERNLYHYIGGHNPNVSVCDDMELLARTFLHTRMVHINKVLYIQYEYGRFSDQKTNTQALRFTEIQRSNWLFYSLYDEQIHYRILELGGTDEIWNYETNKSDLYLKVETPLQDLGYQIY